MIKNNIIIFFILFYSFNVFAYDFKYKSDTSSIYLKFDVDSIEEIKFDRLGIFTYSEEEGTVAAGLEDNVPREVKDERKNSLQDLQQDISLEKNGLFIGKELKVIIDKSTEKVSVGRTEFDSPEIDNIVHVKGEAEVGSFSKVIIQEVNEYELIGEIIKS